MFANNTKKYQSISFRDDIFINSQPKELARSIDDHAYNGDMSFRHWFLYDISLAHMIFHLISVPGAPENITVESDGHGTVITWEPPAILPSFIQRYSVTISNKNGILTTHNGSCTNRNAGHNCMIKISQPLSEQWTVAIKVQCMKSFVLVQLILLLQMRIETRIG